MSTIVRGTRRTLPPILAAFVALLAVVALAGPAQAASYRYWSFWLGSTGTWVAAPVGPGEYPVVDRDVQGWRFGITADAPATPPDNAPVFADLCPALDAASPAAGQFRVAVVVDAGYRADAPTGEVPPADSISCVTVPEGATGNQALAAAVTVTDDQGMICSINGYPAAECTPEVADGDAAAAAQAASAESPNPAPLGASGSAAPSSAPTTANPLGPWGAIAGIAVVAALVVGAVGIARSRRRSDTE